MPKNPKTKFPMDIFLGQIAKIKKEFGLNRKKFENAIGMKNTGRWGKEVKSVELDTLRIISERFNKSLDWLLKEENEADTLEVFDPEGYELRLPAPVDTTLLAKVVAQVESVIINRKLKFSLTKKSRLISLVYTHCSREKEKPTAILIMRYLLLID